MPWLSTAAKRCSDVRRQTVTLFGVATGVEITPRGPARFIEHATKYFGIRIKTKGEGGLWTIYKT